METKNIIKEAKTKGLCDDWYKDLMKNNSLKNLCKKYFDGSDWSLEKDFPSLEILKEYKGKSNRYGLYTDHKGSKSNEQNSAFFGKSKVSLNYDGYFAGKVIARHDSKVEIRAKGNAFVEVELLDNAFIEVETTDNARVTIYQYGNSSNFRITGNVNVKEGKWEK